jgi:hypothetical protein
LFVYSYFQKSYWHTESDWKEIPNEPLKLKEIKSRNTEKIKNIKMFSLSKRYILKIYKWHLKEESNKRKKEKDF